MPISSTVLTRLAQDAGADDARQLGEALGWREGRSMQLWEAIHADRTVRDAWPFGASYVHHGDGTVYGTRLTIDVRFRQLQHFKNLIADPNEDPYSDDSDSFIGSSVTPRNASE